MTTKEKKGTGFFLAILTIVTVVCIIVGCILHLGFGFSRSGIRLFTKRKRKNEKR